MRLKIPMTGTAIDFLPECYKLDSIGVIGHPTDPIRPVNINLGGIPWRLVSIDLDNDLMEVEASAPDKISIPVLDSKGNPVLDSEGFPTYIIRPTTPAEQLQILVNAQNILASYPDDSIYAKTKDKKLVKSADVIKQWNLSKKVAK